ncbi:DnaJ C-terminal domain-containing protein [Loktanella salsilacus]|uniref:DnaJ C-terminal domain-containing protein n=1 Tax=Loktanella salsilacus TaxID=195913 RepID=UPI00356665B9
MTIKPHAYFERRGNDIHVTLPVTITEAALGHVAPPLALAKHRPEHIVQILGVPATALRARAAIALASALLRIVAIGRAGGLFLPAGVDLSTIKLAALFGVGQQFIRGRGFFERSL